MRDPKKLSEYLELDYFRRHRPLRRLRRGVSWGVLLLCVGGLIWTLWPGNRSVYQSAPVSSAHAWFNHDCTQCHSEVFQTAKRLWPGHADLHAVRDEACSDCHTGPLHRETQTHTPACASCHREHRGRPVLALVEDQHCTQCHAELRRADGMAARFENVRDFARHPEFGVVRRRENDPGRLRFPHDKHLAEEGVLVDGRRVRLDCQRCHQVDSAGRYMQPINYERHCKECHPLSASISEDWKDKGLQEAAAAFSQGPVPHAQPAIVRGVLRDRLTQFILRHPRVLDPQSKPESGRPFPGRSPQAVTEKEWQWVNEHLKSEEDRLFKAGGKCAECHHDPLRWSATDGLPEFEKPNVPGVWLERARFSHDRHRMLHCWECHAAAQSKDAADVLLPSIVSCKQCHNPQKGVRSDCAECHKYHGPATERDLIRRRTILESLGR